MVQNHTSQEETLYLLIQGDGSEKHNHCLSPYKQGRPLTSMLKYKEIQQFDLRKLKTKTKTKNKYFFCLPQTRDGRRIQLSYLQRPGKANKITSEVCLVPSTMFTYNLSCSVTYLPEVPRLGSQKVMPCFREQQRSIKKL